jgi:hypothetical protein
VKTLASVAGFLLLVCGCITVAGTFIGMQSEVNSELSPDKRYSYWFQWPGKNLVIMALHRQFFPESNLRKFPLWGMLSIAAGLVILGFTGHL